MHAKVSAFEWLVIFDSDNTNCRKSDAMAVSTEKWPHIFAECCVNYIFLFHFI